MDVESFLTGAVVCFVIVLVGQWVISKLTRSDLQKRQERAEAAIRPHGMEVFTYLPSFGADDEQRQHLAAFDFSGKLILDRDGRLVGRVLPKVVREFDPRRKGLRLVVDNTSETLH
jgi:hypothetical protein